MSNLSTEKNAQCENCELRVIWSKMMTIAWEVVFHRGGGTIYIVGGCQYICDSGEEG